MTRRRFTQWPRGAVLPGFFKHPEHLLPARLRVPDWQKLRSNTRVQPQQ